MLRLLSKLIGGGGIGSILLAALLLVPEGLHAVEASVAGPPYVVRVIGIEDNDIKAAAVFAADRFNKYEACINSGGTQFEEVEGTRFSGEIAPDVFEKSADFRCS